MSNNPAVNNLIVNNLVVNNPVKDAWLANNKVNTVFLEHLTPEMLSIQTPAGGYTIAQHLADMSNAAKYWLSKLENANIDAIGNLYDESAKDFIAEMDLERIRQVFQETTKVILKELEDVDASKLVHKSIESYMIHMLVHDAHHRGQILVTLKVAGYSIPEEDAVWMPWKS